MQSLIISATESTPHIIFDAQKNIFEMKGESRPENAKAFYDPLIDWVRDFCAHTIAHKDHKGKIVFDIHFEYFSSSSAKYLMNIFARLEDLHKHDIPIEIHWGYNDIDIEMKESGEEFQKLLGMPFRFEVVMH